jgi:hypothetical protein
MRGSGGEGRGEPSVVLAGVVVVVVVVVVSSFVCGWRVRVV